jgi:hypothetical protein
LRLTSDPNSRSSRRSSTINESSVHSTRVDLNPNQNVCSASVCTSGSSPVPAPSPSPRSKSAFSVKRTADDPNSLVTYSTELADRRSYAIQLEPIAGRPEAQSTHSTSTVRAPVSHRKSSSSGSSRKKQKSVERNDDHTVKQVRIGHASF